MTVPAELEPSAPPPPPGPGVQAPFATPPTERDRKRMWIGLGVGAALLVLCCGGGLFGFGALVVTRTDALRSEAAAVVSEYLDGLRSQDYGRSYRLLCADVQATTSLTRFTQEHSRPRVLRYTLSRAGISGAEVVVPARVETDDGQVEYRNFTLVEDQDAGGLRICRGG